MTNPPRGLVLLSLVAVGFIVITTVLPSCYVLGMSMKPLEVKAPSLASYQRICADPLYGKATANTVFFAIVSALVQMAAGFLLAKALLATGTRIRTLFFVLLLAPWLMSEMASVIIWRWILAAQVGPLDRLVTWFGLGRMSLLTHTETVLPALILVVLWRGLAFSTIFCLSALVTIPHRLYLAARIEGLGRWRTFSILEFPAVRKALISVTVVLCIHSVSQFTLSARLTGGGPLHASMMLSNYLFEQLILEQDPSISAAGGSLILLSLAVLAASASLVYRWNRNRGK